MNRSIEQKQLTLQIKNYEAQGYLIKMLCLTRWISSVLFINVKIQNFKEFAEWLRDGVILCRLANALKPGIVKDFHYDCSSKTKALENLLYYLNSLLQFGIPRDHRFGPLDLFEEKNLNKVVDCLEELAEKQNCPMEKFLQQGLDDGLIKETLSPNNIKKTIKMLIENERDPSTKKDSSRPQGNPSIHEALLIKQKTEEDLSTSCGSAARILEIDDATLSNLMPLLEENYVDEEEVEQKKEVLGEKEADDLKKIRRQKRSSTPNFASSTKISLELNVPKASEAPPANMDDFMNFLYKGNGGKPSGTSPTSPTSPIQSRSTSPTPPTAPTAHNPLTSSSSTSIPVGQEQKERRQQQRLSSIIGLAKHQDKKLHRSSTAAVSDPTSNHLKNSAMRTSITVPLVTVDAELPSSPLASSDPSSDKSPALSTSPSSPCSPLHFEIDPEVESFLLTRHDTSVNFARMNPKKLHRERDGFTADLIIAGLYLGDKKSAFNLAALQERNITHVISMIGDTPFESKVQYLNQSIDDAVDQDIITIFPTTNAFIQKARESSGGVLVHCQKGVSRSATVVIAFLMFSQRLSFYDASDFVCLKRAIVCPNLGFIEQLKQYENQTQIQPPPTPIPAVSKREEVRLSHSHSSIPHDQERSRKFSALKHLIHGHKRSEKEKDRERASTPRGTK
eukprot:TRINITY_DN17281_c0_g1_i1.p1 TRINITY_DN17281_c0_g1~~TRINITY_DN17281_c0_g1_i1.p1  ORF type:complete len:677 (-),score=163.30 TRINITY_DN17281_c0_g1_i1:300-2330(-)